MVVLQCLQINYTELLNQVPCDQCDTGYEAAGSWVKTGRGHPIPLQAGTGPYGSRRLRIPELLDT